MSGWNPSCTNQITCGWTARTNSAAAKPWRRRSKIGVASAVGQCGQEQRNQQEHRPVLGQHGCRRGQPGKGRPADVPRVERAHEGPGGERPQRDQRGVVIELEAEEVVERNHRKQERHRGALVAVEPFAREQEGEVEARPEHEPGQQVVRPVGKREEREPARHQPDGERRMLRIAERQLARPHHDFRCVGVEVLRRFGDDGVERPYQRIDDGEPHHRAMTPCRIAERVNEALDRRKQAVGKHDRD